ncbi:MAG: glycerol kinase [Clostridia bacterium]|nr:glycerol kinase [Clostridia bacterium]
MCQYILTIDEGTTSERVILYDTSAKKIVDSHSSPIKSFYPQAGWAEQDAEEIWQNVKTSLLHLVKKHKLSNSNTIGIGITNQREAVCSFDDNGNQLAPVISWQCKRTTDFCDNINDRTKSKIQAKTGLIMDSYFSASKMKWLLENNENVKKALKSGNLHFGTIDTMLIYKLTDGKSFTTDTSNASRTMLVDLTKPFEYDGELLKFWGLKPAYLPKILNSVDSFGTEVITGLNLPILSVIGDQQSSLVGQGTILPKTAKMTYGTGGFLLVNTGNKIVENNDKLLNTVAYSIKGKTTYAIEGSIFNCGSALNFIKNTLNMFNDYSELDRICHTTKSDGVCFFPTFTGIGAPYWNGNLRGSISEMTFDTDKNKITKATIESFAFSLQEILDELKAKKVNVKEITCDGGVSKTDYLLDLISCTAKIVVRRSSEPESTAMGATYLAMLSSGVIKSLSDITSLVSHSKTFEPDEELAGYAKRMYAYWHKKLLNRLQFNAN